MHSIALDTAVTLLSSVLLLHSVHTITKHTVHPQCFTVGTSCFVLFPPQCCPECTVPSLCLGSTLGASIVAMKAKLVPAVSAFQIGTSWSQLFCFWFNFLLVCVGPQWMVIQMLELLLLTWKVWKKLLVSDWPSSRHCIHLVNEPTGEKILLSLSL